MNDPACCSETCVCRLGYPENRKTRQHITKESFVMEPTGSDTRAAASWKMENEHPCNWFMPVDCVAYHYPGGWPAFIIEQIDAVSE